MTSASPSAKTPSGTITTRQHVRRIFQWLEQINVDKKLPSSALKIALVIAQHLNKESGEAWPSTETIGTHCALYPSSVRTMIAALVERGHLSVEWGRQGRGHPNRYRLILKPQQPAVSTRSKKPQQAAVLKSRRKPQPDKTKPQPNDLKTAAACHEPLKNHLNNHQSAPPARSSARVERGDVTETETNSDDAALSEPLRPIQRAPEGALIETVEAQNQKPSCANSMGTTANGANGGSVDPAMAEFERVTREYRADRIGDRAAALLAFNAAVDSHGLSKVIEAVADVKLDYDDDVPYLVGLLMTIARNP